jgi:hypothetical protein
MILILPDFPNYQNMRFFTVILSTIKYEDCVNYIDCEDRGFLMAFIIPSNLWIIIGVPENGRIDG